MLLWTFLVEEMLLQLFIFALLMMILAYVFKRIQVNTFVHMKRREVMMDLSLICIVIAALTAFTMLFSSMIEMMSSYMLLSVGLFILVGLEGYWLSKMK